MNIAVRKMEHFYLGPQFGENWTHCEDVYQHAVERAPDVAHFVEVGSWKGRSAAYMAVEIANSGKSITFDCVDTWDLTYTIEARGVIGMTVDLFSTFERNTAPVAHLIHPLRMTSIMAAGLYADRSLDFVFIDASHDYASVREDIIAWLPKVKAGGLLAGDDLGGSWYPEVGRAVAELVRDGVLDVEGMRQTEMCWLY